MITTIAFNSKTSPYASTSTEANLMYIRYVETYLNDLLKVRGYIYLNRIYEELGMKWNPEWDNLCLLHKSGASVKFGIRGSNEDGFDIDIL